MMSSRCQSVPPQPSPRPCKLLLTSGSESVPSCGRLVDLCDSDDAHNLSTPSKKKKNSIPLESLDDQLKEVKGLLRDSGPLPFVG